MTIIVMKGGAPAQPPTIARADSEEELRARPRQDVMNHSIDMTDVLNLKVFKISKPNFVDGSTTTTLIGEDIFFPREESVLPHPATAVNKKPVDSITTAKKPSLLQSIRAYKYMSSRTESNSTSIMKEVAENNERFKRVKAGQLPHDTVVKVTLQQAFEWAVQYVKIHESHLSDNLIQLDDRVNGHDSDRNNVKKTQLQSTKPLNATAEHSAKPTKTQSLQQQLEALKQQGTDGFLKAVGGTESLAATVSPNKRADGSTKAGSKSIVREAMEPSKPNGSRKFGSNTIRQRGRKTSTLASTSGDTAKEDSGIVEDTVAFAEDIVLAETEPLHVIVEQSETEENDSSDVFGDPLAANPDESLGDGDAVDDADDGDKDDQSIRAPEGVSCKNGVSFALPNAALGVQSGSPATSARESKHSHKSALKLPKKMKYSNTKVDFQENRAHLTAQDTIDDLKRSQMQFLKSLGYSLGIFKDANNKQSSLERQTTKRLTKANLQGERLVEGFSKFQEKKQMALDVGLHQCSDRALHRGEILRAKANVFDESQYSRNFVSGSGSLLKDMQKMRSVGRDVIGRQQLDRILALKWFVSALSHTREMSRRLGNQYPACCSRFLTVLEQLIYLNFGIDTAIFYQILLTAEVIAKDDFRKNAVHQLLDIVREGLNISPEEFAQFLEQNNLQLSPELMALIRNNAQAKTLSHSSRPQPPRQPRMSSACAVDVTLVQTSVALGTPHDPQLSPDTDHIAPLSFEKNNSKQSSFSAKRAISLPPLVTDFDITKKDGLLGEDEEA